MAWLSPSTFSTPRTFALWMMGNDTTHRRSGSRAFFWSSLRSYSGQSCSPLARFCLNVRGETEKAGTSRVNACPVAP